MPILSDGLLFIFDMANNHMGDVAHGHRIIEELARSTSDLGLRCVIKFQYRDLPNFIHRRYRGRTDIKYVKRFSETRLSAEQFDSLRAAAREAGFLTMCTPFDEASVDLIEEQGFDLIKIASCSFTDWPLLERVVRCDLPAVASTAGAVLEDIDKVVSFFGHRSRPLALMHCVALYPTPEESLCLSRIGQLRARYADVPIGFSTHEAPDNLDAVKLAIAAGAVLLERHVGVATDEFTLNAYSSTPAQARAWLGAAKHAMKMLGSPAEAGAEDEGEQATLRALRRGAFARRAIAKGERISQEDLDLAIPLEEDQITANDLSKYTDLFALEPIPEGDAVFGKAVRRVHNREKVMEIVKRAKALVAQSKVVVPGRADFEISHHYGIERFDEVGTTLITIVNRDYCKKLIIQLPDQVHPEQHHLRKEETFHVLYGRLRLSLDGEESEHGPGDVITVQPGVKHAFSSDTGAVIEEISSTHYADDSRYTDPAILENKHRKTYLTYWMD
jgi:sialic acid synthase SpsE/quercetin dioxygenase-like cupin family protein